ncbi:winged helix DNA-binding domain-containing protein, partial [Hesseltinella vesiculosa]
PPYTYATLIAHAMLSSDEGCMTLHQIYQWISKKYPYYSMANRGWQNSIRHNLSLNKKKFKKLARAERHRGSHWTLLKEAQ